MTEIVGRTQQLGSTAAPDIPDRAGITASTQNGSATAQATTSSGSSMAPLLLAGAAAVAFLLMRGRR